MSDTPRTDREAAEFYESEGVAGCSVHIARQLERELAEAKRERDEVKAWLNAATARVSDISAKRDTWRTRCKEAQRCLGESIRVVEQSCSSWLPEWVFARDAGKDE